MKKLLLFLIVFNCFYSGFCFSSDVGIKVIDTGRMDGYRAYIKLVYIGNLEFAVLHGGMKGSREFDISMIQIFKKARGDSKSLKPSTCKN